MKKALPPTYFLLVLVLVALLHFAFPLYRYWTFPMTLMGIVPLGLGVALNLIADRAFKLHETTVKPFEQSTSLVTDFPFSLSRNPMYLGLSLMLLGVALLLGTASALGPVLVFPYLMHRIFIRTEEQMLAAKFGPAWERYRSTVRRWI